MFERFTRTAKAAVGRAHQIAAEEGASTVEAEHLLLALAQGSTPRAGRALRKLDMTEEPIREALDREFHKALQTVGVGPVAGPARRQARPFSKPRFGQSARLALERSYQVALARGDRRIEDHHILLALAQAEAGVLPRLLKELDVTPTGIASEVD